MDKQYILTAACALTAIVSTIAYLRCRRTCACNSTESKSMEATKVILYDLHYPYTLPPLKYAYNALEPHLDAETLTIHHTKHHQGYVDNLNKALAEAPAYQGYSLEMLLANIDALPTTIRERVRAHGGGHLNHTLFWDLMSPNGGGKPIDTVAAAINKNFGSFDAFKEQFTKAAQGYVGSGWAWLCVTPQKTLVIMTTNTHDTPLAKGLYPVLVMDIWEHAYYLKFRNKRADFITAWWNVVNWNYVEKLFNDAEKALR